MGVYPTALARDHGVYRLRGCKVAVKLFVGLGLTMRKAPLRVKFTNLHKGRFLLNYNLQRISRRLRY
jgi:hypothetical protein